MHPIRFPFNFSVRRSITIWHSSSASLFRTLLSNYSDI
ncbi:hypothetical protein NBRC111894_983 [Sporolactobacillus inulinus]|uniref:Uncharacterized protein n=1 Tax=Sporolactobacillus inulinus TaxID=2078 RepID=A0A4Y1Z8Q2_9BACL|nr:hypothetical protein NBRC111894_983 [Sporolactobacillus inulinus]